MSSAPTVGMAIPERQHYCDEVQQMLYNASLWNGHRIHFDMPYATEVEGYPGLVVAGPLMGDWLHQVVDEWLGDAGMITGIEYSNRIAAYVGETVTSGGTVAAYDEATGEVTLEVFVKNERDEVLTPGVITATLTLASGES
jgi:3-methylfumaryl-CoA hydratase